LETFLTVAHKLQLVFIFKFLGFQGKLENWTNLPTAYLAMGQNSTPIIQYVHVGVLQRPEFSKKFFEKGFQGSGLQSSEKRVCRHCVQPQIVIVLTGISYVTHFQKVVFHYF
jgi:hypothetical protein